MPGAKTLSRLSSESLLRLVKGHSSSCGRKKTLPKSLQHSPFPQIPTLPMVLDTAELSKHFEGIAVPAMGPGRPSRVQVSVLKLQSGRRCTVAISLQADGGLYDLVGKVYPADRSDVYRAMQAIQ